MLEPRLVAAPIVPLIQSDFPEIALKTVEALHAGGLSVMEVVLRTDGALSCLEAIAREVPGVAVGAGTVLTAEQAEQTVRLGAQFIVSPGLDDGVVKVCQSKQIELLPGTVTATEVQRAWNYGLRTVKFFPASLSGGAPMLKAFASVFKGMRFMPTGGISPANLTEYLSNPAVIACGGSWLTPAGEIEAGNYAAVTELAREAVKLAQTVRAPTVPAA